MLAQKLSMAEHTIRAKPADAAGPSTKEAPAQKPGVSSKPKHRRRRTPASFPEEAQPKDAKPKSIHEGKDDRPPPPAHWVRYVDAKSGRPYWHDCTSGVTQWDDPNAKDEETDDDDDGTPWIDRLAAEAVGLDNASDGDDDSAVDAGVAAAARDLEKTLNLDEDAGAYLARLALSELLCDGDAKTAVATAVEAAAPFLEDGENDADATEPLARALVKALVALRGGVSVQRSKQDDAVTALREVFPAVRVELVEEHVRRAKGDANVAAGTLVQASLDALKRGEESERKGRVITRDAFFDHVLSKDERKKLFDEYHMEKEVKEHHPIVHSDGGKRELRKQTRYRDGKVASTTGERFLVEPKESAEFVKATSVSIRVTGGGRTH